MWLSEATNSFLIRTLAGFNQPDGSGKSKRIQIDVKYVSFGKTPLIIEGIELKEPSSPYQVRLDLHFQYRGDLSIELEAALPFMKVPIKLSEIEMQGRLVVEMSFRDRGRIQRLSMYYFETPSLNFSIRTVGKLDMMDLPMLKETIKGQVITALDKAMRYSNALRFDWSEKTEPVLSEEEQVKMRGAFLHQTVSALDEEPKSGTTTNLGASTTILAESSSQTSPGKSSTTIIEPNTSIAQQTGPIPTATSSDPLTSSSSNVTSNLTSPSKPKTGSTKLSSDTKNPSSATIPTPSASSSTSSQTTPTRQTPQAISTKKEEDLNEFLLLSPEEFRGTLRVRVFACTQLSSGDLFRVNPYVVLESNGVTHRTDVVKRTVNPVWTNADFKFPVPKFLSQKGLSLKIQVFDQNKIGSDDSLGHVLISLNGLLQKPDSPEAIDAPLIDALFANSQIHMECTFIPE